MENDGDARICRRRRQIPNSNSNSNSNSGQVFDRKLDLLVKELQRLNVDIAGMQQSKWFGQYVWPAIDGFTLLHSGRNTPQHDDTFIGREGVGILLNARMTAAWKAAGSSWKAVNSRIVTARLLVSTSAQKQQFMMIVSVYAPTFKATHGHAVKEHFYNELQHTINEVDPCDQLIVLGDFNAHFGSLQPEEDWTGTLGKFGLGARNTAGEDLL